MDPVSKSTRNNYGGVGNTVIDSLDTLHLMGLSNEFNVARDWVRDRFDPSSLDVYVSVFETTIRCLGGLISAYDLTGAIPQLLRRAQ